MSSDIQINSSQSIVASNNHTNPSYYKISTSTTASNTTSIPTASPVLVNLTTTTITSNSTKMSNLIANTNEHWYDLPKMDNFVDIFSVCCSTAVIFGGLIPYIPQYLKIKRSMSSEGFSTYVCLTLLIANILRICFWFGHPFEMPLLIQSFVMIAGMMAMMELCVRVRDKQFAPYSISSIGGPTAINQRRRNQINGDFWDWDDFFSYIKFLTLFTLTVALITYLLLDVHFYIETLGFVAVFAESMLGMPQLARNYRKQSTRGMSVEMVAMWLSGDLFKTLYFILRKAPAQFYICGSVQVIVDILILGQVLWYRRPMVAYRKLPKTTKH